MELNKAEIARERLELDYKKKMQLAFEAFEKNILDEIKKNPDIKERFSSLLRDLKRAMQLDEE